MSCNRLVASLNRFVFILMLYPGPFQADFGSYKVISESASTVSTVILLQKLTIAKQQWCRINSNGRGRVLRRQNGFGIWTNRRSTSDITCPRACTPRRWPCPWGECRSLWSGRPRRKICIQLCRVFSWPVCTRTKNVYLLYSIVR